MQRATLSLALLILLLGGLLGHMRLEATSTTDTRYALVALRNTTSVPVTYSYWWGNASWSEGGGAVAGEYTLQPGASCHHHWPYYGGGSAPPFRVAFRSFVPGRTIPHSFLREYALTANYSAINEYRYAREYNFGLGSDGYLDLFDDN